MPEPKGAAFSKVPPLPFTEADVDIIEELRDFAAPDENGERMLGWSLAKDAANEIERLRALVEQG